MVIRAARRPLASNNNSASRCDRAKKVISRHRLSLSYDPSVISLILDRCTEPESGGRMIDAILTNTLLPDISNGLLRRVLASEPTTSVHVGVEDGALSYTFE